MTLAGPSAVFIDPEVERWLIRRAAHDRGRAAGLMPRSKIV